MRVTNTTPTTSVDNLLVKSSRELANFIKLDPEQNRKIAELICSISDAMGKEGLQLLQEFTKALAEGDLHEFSKRWADKKIAMSILSDLLAISQEMEANTREKLDALILKAKRAAIKLSKHALQKAILILI